MPSIILPHRGGKTKMTTGTGASTVLGAGELFVEYPDTGVGSGKSKIKIGDGVTAYSSLPYALGDTSTDLIVFDSSTATTVAQALAEAVSGASLATIVAGFKKAIELNTSSKVFTGSLADWEQLTDEEKLEYDIISNDEPGGLQEMFPSSRVGYSTNSNVESELNKLNSNLTVSGTNHIRFGIDSNNNYGYYKVGADTVTPFSTPERHYGTPVEITSATASDLYTCPSDGFVTAEVNNASDTATVDVIDYDLNIVLITSGGTGNQHQIRNGCNVIKGQRLYNKIVNAPGTKVRFIPIVIS